MKSLPAKTGRREIQHFCTHSPRQAFRPYALRHLLSSACSASENWHLPKLTLITLSCIRILVKFFFNTRFLLHNPAKNFGFLCRACFSAFHTFPSASPFQASFVLSSSSCFAFPLFQKRSLPHRKAPFPCSLNNNIRLELSYAHLDAGTHGAGQGDAFQILTL